MIQVRILGLIHALKHGQHGSSLMTVTGHCQPLQILMLSVLPADKQQPVPRWCLDAC